MKKKLIHFTILFLLLFSLFSFAGSVRTSSSLNWLTKKAADNFYCQINGDYVLNSLNVTTMNVINITTNNIIINLSIIGYTNITGNLSVVGSISTPEIFNLNGNLKIQPDAQGNITLFEDASGNMYLYQYGAITDEGAVQKYVRWRIDDTDDYYTLEREDVAVLGLKIKMPVDLEANSFTTTDTGNFGQIIDNGLTANLGVYTTAGKQLTSTIPTSGILGYWSRTGSVITTATAGDTIFTLGNGRFDNGIVDSMNTASLIPEARTLQRSDGGTIVDYGAGILYENVMLDPVLNWFGQVLISPAGNPQLNWSTDGVVDFLDNNISTAGNVGIGAAPSVYKLDVSGGGETTALFYDPDVNVRTKVFFRTAKANSGAAGEYLVHILDPAGAVVAGMRSDGGIYGKFLATNDNSVAAISQSTGQTFGIGLKDTGMIEWSSTTNWYGAKDTGLSRISAGVIGVGDGSQGDFTGTLMAANVGIGTLPSEELHIKSTTPVMIIESATNNAEGGKIRFSETTAWQGGYIHYDGSTNQVIFGTHNVNDETLGNDIPVFSFRRAGDEVRIPNDNIALKLGANRDTKIVATGTSLDIIANVHDASDNMKFTAASHIFNGSVNVTGNITGNAIHGGAFFHNDTNDFTVALDEDIWNNFTGFDNGGNGQVLNGFDYLNSRLIVIIPGQYDCEYGSSSTGTANNRYHSTMGLNGAPLDSMEAHGRVSTGTDILEIADGWFIDLVVDDELTLMFMNENSGGDLDVVSAHMKCIRVGD